MNAQEAAKAQINRYHIYWIEFRSINGNIPKSDIAKLKNSQFPSDLWVDGNGCVYRHFRSKDAAIDFLKNFSKSLKRSYEARLFTDKQYSMRVKENNYEVLFTKKQYEEVYYIG